MAEHYRFMDAVEQEDGTYDREYNAQEFTDYFKALITTGLMKGAGNQLTVTANGSNMITKVDTGIAFLLGRYYENDSFKELTHDTETLGNSRIDRIVIRMDLSTEARYVKAFIKKGAPSANPVPPALTQTPNLYEISLAQVKVVGGQTFIAANAVTDERGKDIICPWAGSNILPSFDDNALAEHMQNDDMHTPYVVSTGTADLYNVDLGSHITELYPGLSFAMDAHVANSNYPKVSVNGLPSTYMTLPNGSLLPANQLKQKSINTFRYNGQFFIMQGTSSPVEQRVAVTPWSGWQHDSTYNISVYKIDKMVRVLGNIKKTATSGPILCVIPEGYRPTIERVPFMLLAPNTSGTFKPFFNSYIMAANGYIMLDPTEMANMQNGSNLYFDFSYSILT